MEVAKPVLLTLFTACFITVAPWLMGGSAGPITPMMAAEAPAAKPVDWVETLVEKTIAQLGPLGILAWYLWYSASKRMPQKDAEVTQARADFSATLEKQTSHHEAVVAKVLDELQAERALVLETIRACEVRRKTMADVEARHKDGGM